MNAMRSKSSQSQSGLAMVEAIIVLPIILFLAMVAAEFSHMMMLQNTLNKAMQDGATYIAREAISAANPDQIILDDVGDGNVNDTKNIIVYGEIDGLTNGATPVLEGFTLSDVTVELDGLDGHVRIEIEYDFPTIFGDFLSSFGFGASGGGWNLAFPLRSSITVRALG